VDSVLIGVGLLSLPMGFKYAGWLCGMVALFLCAAVTAWTAKLLAKCMDLDPSLITFSDLAYISFGRNARIATSVLFTLELLAACVALIVLFAESLDLLFPGFLTVTGWKVFCSIILMPLNFLPLRLLSFTSVIGIFSCFTSKCRRTVAVPGGTLTWNRSRAHPGSRRLDKAELAGVAHRAGQDLPLSRQLADPAAVLWPADVPMGRPRRVSQRKS
jgi:hypothetical protein